MEIGPKTRLVFAAFFQDLGDEAWRTYVQMMHAGQRQLARVQKGGVYVVICDAKTADVIHAAAPDIHCWLPGLESDAPLMVRELDYQEQFLTWMHCEMPGVRTCLVSPDCLPLRDMTDAVGSDLDVGVTIKRSGDVINILYCNDVLKAARLLGRSRAWLEGGRGPAFDKLRAWLGDQLSIQIGGFGAWQHVIASEPVIYPMGIRVALLPSATHNFSPPRKSTSKKPPEGCYLVHFKGTRKAALFEYERKVLCA